MPHISSSNYLRIMLTACCIYWMLGASLCAADDTSIRWENTNGERQVDYLSWDAYPDDPFIKAVRQLPLVEPATGMSMVWVPGGCYQMGDAKPGKQNDAPAHKVCVDGFWLGQFEVTQAEWQSVMGNNPSHFVNPKNPVENVSWNDTQRFIAKLNGKSGGKYRLPTEAEWEFAARAGATTTYWWGDDLGQNNANCLGCGSSWDGKSPAPAGSFSPNVYGLYDLAGNVWEWTHDTYTADAYARHAKRNPVCTEQSNRRVYRGGSWYNGPDSVRTSKREANRPEKHYRNVGFRLARSQ